MNKLLIVTSVALLLSACGEKDKDAEYYSKNTQELQPILVECKQKIANVKKVEEFTQLEGDKTCTMAYRAKLAIELGGMDKALVAESSKSAWSKALATSKFTFEKWQSISEDLSSKK